MKKLKTFFMSDRAVRNPYKKKFGGFFDFIENLGGVLKVSITALILLLFAADYYTIYDLFREPQFNFDPLVQKILATVFAAVLEGLPCLFSAALCKLMDSNIKDRIERRKQKIVLAVSSVSIVLMFSLVIFLRVNVLLGKLGTEKQAVLISLIDTVRTTDSFALEQFFDLLSTDKISADIFLTFSPIITSVFALLLSMGYTSSDYLDILRRKFEAINRKSKKANFNKSVAKGKSETMKQELWNELGLLGTPPEDREEFCNMTYDAIRQNMVDDGVEAFKVQVCKFNLEVESELQRCLIRISECSSIPLEITKLNVRDIIAEYDGAVPGDPNNPPDGGGGAAADPFSVWSYSRSVDALSEKLRETIIHDIKKTDFRNASKENPAEYNGETEPFYEVVDDDIENNSESGENFNYGASHTLRNNPFDSGATDASSVTESGQESFYPEKQVQKEFDSANSDERKGDK